VVRVARWGTVTVLALAAATAAAVAAWGSPGTLRTATARLGAFRSLSTGYYGINFDYGTTAKYAGDPRLDSDLGALVPGTLRWPGGTGANYFQWRQGTIALPRTHATGACSEPSPPVRPHPGYRFTLAALRAAHDATGAPPIFDLNVMTSTVSSQLAMLRTARRIGLPVSYVELGNELYLCNDDYVHYFPTAAAYGATVARYSRAIRREFPRALVAAVGSASSENSRERTWNSEMLRAARLGGALPDAVTLHEYPDGSRPLTAGELPRLFAEPYAAIDHLTAVAHALPGRPPVWITEYNLARPRAVGRAAQTTYAQALVAAELDLLLPDVRASRLVDYWAAFGAPDYAYSGARPTLTPSGLALQWTDLAASCTTSTAPVRFAGGPLLGPGKPALVGRAFRSRQGTAEVLLNLSGRAWVLAGGGAVPTGAPYRQVTGNPLAVATDAGALAQSSGTVGGRLVLPAYSLTLAGSVPSCGPATSRPRLPRYGVNFDLAGFEPFAHAPVDSLLAGLDPATLRWPGGTEADFYDWHTGQSTRKPGPVPFTLGDLASASQATGAIPIFDLNVFAPGNRTNPADQIAMLEKARSLGMPIKYVEIGNELYSNQPGFSQAYPDGAAYGRTVAIYARALHAAFPGVQVGADAIPFGASGRRDEGWDAGLLATATGSGAPDALIVHFYPGQCGRSFSAAELPALFAKASSAIAQLSQTVSGFGGKPVWLTEYNFRGPYRLCRREGPSPAERTYAHELYLAAFAAMLTRVPHLALVDNWTAFADGFYGAWVDPQAPALSPGGQAVAMVDAAARNAVASAPLAVPGAPTLPGGAPGVVGQRFTQLDGSVATVLVNLTSSRVAIPASSRLAAGSRYQQVQGDPMQPQTVAGTPSVGVVGPGGIDLPPYSITLVGATIATASSASEP
jgi:hypothetical protein